MKNNIRSYVSQNSNSLNGMIKKISMTLTNVNLRKISAITTAIIMLSATGTFGFSPIEEAFAKGKRQEVIDWSNGFPSGPHWNLNIHGKKLHTDVEQQPGCDNTQGTGPYYGKSVVVPLNTTQAIEEFPEYGPEGTDTIDQINFISNKRSSVTDLTVLDPCGAPFGNVTQNDVDEILVQYPADMEAQVYWRILGNHGGGPNKDISEATITHPALLDTCDFLPTEYTDGSTVTWFDPDCTACDEFNSDLGSQGLAYFLNGTEMYENSTGTTAGFSLFETIYNDTDTSDSVTNLDIRLANANNTSWDYTDSSIVNGNPSNIGNDFGELLFNFTNNFMYNDTNTDTDFSVDETVYDDVDDNQRITPGDIRVANAASVGLDKDAGGDLLTCTDEEQLVGLGLVSNKGVFGIGDDGVTLERFDESDTDGENSGKGSKHGKSKAIDVTGLFKWTGFVCETTELDGNDDNKLTFEDFDLNMDDVINGTDIDILNDTAIFGEVFTEASIMAAEDVVAADIDPDTETNDNDEIDNQAEFDAWIDIILQAIVDGGFTKDGEPICQYFDDHWIFDVADIVLYGFDYKNNGSSLTQLRFYPTATLNTGD
jgi:hypothetical protein